MNRFLPPPPHSASELARAPRRARALGLLLVSAAGALVALAPSASRAAGGAAATLHIDLTARGPAIPPTFGGLMTEEINHSYDGGLFAELIQNRTFQDPAPQGWTSPSGLPVHWSLVGHATASVDRNDPVNAALPVSLTLDLAGDIAGVANDGYWGIPVRTNTTYAVTFYAKAARGFAGPVTAALVTDAGEHTVAATETPPMTETWQKYTLTLKTGAEAPTTARARFVLSARGTGRVSFSFVSLFPPTWQNTPGGLRPDLMKLLADLRPAFIRLPGGNYIEGSTFATRFNWKQMIGPAEERPGHMGCWSYRSSDGFGLPQYLLWCKQVGAEPVLALFAGYVLNGDHVNAGSPQMAHYTQEALQEIEYVSGPADSEWGRRRAADGFPDPFPLHYVEIGNEDWFDRSGSYDGRFAEMAAAIRKKYPHLKLIATAPVKSLKPDLYDDHFYRTPGRMLTLGHQYDNDPSRAASLTFSGGGWNGRQPDGIQTFVGEWAAQEGRPTPDLNAALADAAFVMDLEQNADAVPMECYAPLLVNVSPEDPAMHYPKGWQWSTNLIGYDALGSFGSPSYYAQAMLAQNRGDVALRTRSEAAPTAARTEPAPEVRGRVGVGMYHTAVEYQDLVVSAPDGRMLFKADLRPEARGWQFVGGQWKLSGDAIGINSTDIESWALTGEPMPPDYTIRVRARKLGGREGFLVLWQAKDGQNFHWWNIGGWGNTVARVQVSADGTRDVYGPSTPVQIETGRWYDLRLDVKGRSVRGYIDGKLVTTATEEIPVIPELVATATYSTHEHVVLVKLVNPHAEPRDVVIDLGGAARIEPDGVALVLSGDAKAVNTVEQPTNVIPRRETFSGVSRSFRRTLPPHSLTVLRLEARPR